MGHATTAEYQLARKTAEEYRKKGYAVSVKAPLDFLAGYRADLVVQKDDQVKVIEVKTRTSLAASSRVDDLARAIDAKPGWSFELLLVAEPEKLEPPEEAQSFEREQVLERLEEAEAILATGHVEAAFLLAWSACEAALRLAIADQGASNEGITTAAHTLGQAAYLGVISRAEYRQLTDLQRHRNAIVHGFSHGGFGETSMRDLLEVVRGITAATANGSGHQG